MPRPKGSKNKPKEQVPEYVPIPQATKEPTPNYEFREGDKVLTNIDGVKDTPYAKMTSDLIKFKFNTSNSSMVAETTADNCFKLFENNLNTSQADIGCVKGSYNSEKLGKEGSLVDDSDAKENRFRGGTSKDIINAMNGKFNAISFLKKREEIKKKFSKLAELEAAINRKRSRVMSEHDGELDFDRLYELNPFHSTRFSNDAVSRIINVNVDFTFSAGVDSDKINEFGATVWAVINLLENSGIQCNVNLVNAFDHITYTRDDGKPNPRRIKIISNIKRAGDYIDTMDIARCFTSNYFRRVVFTTVVSICEMIGCNTSWGLGYPEYFDSNLKNSKGEINFKIGQMIDFNLNQDELINFIKEAL
jgi:hypothetical protein